MDVTELTDLPVRRDVVQQEIDRLTSNLSAEELRTIVDWIDLWLYGRGNAQ